MIIISCHSTSNNGRKRKRVAEKQVTRVWHQYYASSDSNTVYADYPFADQQV
jgi:hypothetical protein